ncbi:ankyrin repeat-containing domain protein [Stachybotrys elegans]|uniref:Ankyrin repeat-containing domain protein n=1 Tax=Stachybotrys elegans TaxID=80388 RepID=A0A8K0WJ80_9HYPO|nr:ankyrin repeat-containing domain protein [Stachybotrys elegans]
MTHDELDPLFGQVDINMSGVEALAAIGLASNIVAFIETALKIYKSANNNLSGLSDEFQNISDLTSTLQRHTAAVAEDVGRSLAPEDQRVVEIATQCHGIALDLLRVIQKYEISDGRFRNIAIVGKAIRATWNRQKIRDMETLLEKYHRQLTSHLVVSCRSRLDGLSEDARKSALNTVALLEQSQQHHEDMNFSLKKMELGITDINAGFEGVESKLDDIHAILSRSASPVPPYEPVKAIGDSGTYPSIVGPGGHIEAQSMPLHEAALKGETKSIHLILHSNGISINARDDNGQTALHLSALAGDVGFTKALLQEDGLDVDAMDNGRTTPLHYAVKGRCSKTVALLLQHDARKDIQDSDGMVPADYAEKHTPIAWMLNRGIDQDAKNEALLEFSKRGDSGGVEEMLSLGAKADAKAIGGNRALMYGAIHGNTDIIKAVCQHDKLSINKANSVGKTALMLAVIRGHLEAVRALLAESPNLEIKDLSERRTALFHALAHAHAHVDEGVDSRWAIATALRRAGADVETEDAQNCKPLAWFCKTGKFSAVKWLVDAGADVNFQRKKEFWTPLIEAAACKDEVEGACRIIECLVDHGADTELWNKQTGHTALWQAASDGHLRQVEVLLARGAHVNTMSRQGLLPLAIACYKGHHKVVEVLLRHGSYVNTRDHADRMPINYASQHRHLRCVQLLIQHGSPLSVQNERLWSPLHEAAHRDQYDMMTLLLKHGISIDLRTDEDETALHIACKQVDSRCAELLIQHGASVSATKSNGWTPLDEASKRGLQQTMKALLAAGADPNSKSSRLGGLRGYTPLMHAAREGKLEACRTLVDHGANVGLSNSSGESAYQIAKSYPRVQEFLGQCRLRMK